MIITPATLKDVYVIDLEKRGDDRGFFARTFCEREFAAHGLETRFPQHNTSFSRHAGTLRGMHFQIGEAGEAKVMRCLRGAIFDVLIDLRPDSPTFQRWEGFELTDTSRRMLYAPKGMAHGFLTLSDDVEVSYLMSEFYAPGTEGGVRWNDPVFGIAWPHAPLHINARDESWPDFRR